MIKQYTYTSTLPIELKEALELYAARYKVSKNKIIEKALKKFLTEERKKAYVETFKKANKDPEMIAMADWGLEDYLKQLKDLEKIMWQREIWLADLEPIKGREQGGRRPVVIISGDTMNGHYGIRIICPLSSQIKNFTGCLLLKKDKLNRLPKDSEVLTFQLRTISTARLIKKIGQITPEQLREIRLFLNEILTY